MKFLKTPQKNDCAHRLFRKNSESAYISTAVDIKKRSKRKARFVAKGPGVQEYGVDLNQMS